MLHPRFRGTKISIRYYMILRYTSSWLFQGSWRAGWTAARGTAGAPWSVRSEAGTPSSASSGGPQVDGRLLLNIIVASSAKFTNFSFFVLDPLNEIQTHWYPRLHVFSN